MVTAEMGMWAQALVPPTPASGDPDPNCRRQCQGMSVEHDMGLMFRLWGRTVRETENQRERQRQRATVCEVVSVFEYVCVWLSACVWL